CAARSARKLSFVGADMNSRERDREAWPDLPYRVWKDTCATLQLWTQIVGKIRLSQTPWLNHSWHVALYMTARGLTTSPIPFGERVFQIDLDFIPRAAHRGQRRPTIADAASCPVGGGFLCGDHGSALR